MAEYNGWSNYETWAVALWFGNEQSTSQMTNDWAIAAWDTAKEDITFTRKESLYMWIAA